MSKYEVTTLQGRFTVDAESDEQARLLGKDGGRVVLDVREVGDGDAGEFVADVDPEGHSFDATHPDAAIIESPSSDFGDQEIVIVRRADWDRAVGLARLNDESFETPEAVPVDQHDVQGPTYRDPTAAVEVSEATDDPGLPAPREDRASEAFENAGGEPYDPARREAVQSGDVHPYPYTDDPAEFVPADDVPGDASDATEETPAEADAAADEYRVSDGDPPPPTTYGGRRDPHDRT